MARPGRTDVRKHDLGDPVRWGGTLYLYHDWDCGGFKVICNDHMMAFEENGLGRGLVRSDNTAYVAVECEYCKREKAEEAYPE